MAHAREQFCSGLGHLAILLTAASALAAAAAFLLFLPEFRDVLTQGLNTRVALPLPEPRAPAQKFPPRTILPEPQSLIARILPGTGKTDGVMFDTVIPAASPETNAATLPSPEPTSRQFAKIVISEVAIADENSARHEFVELYNPNAFAVDLAGWELRKKTQSGTDSVLVSAKKFSGAIRASGYFLVAHPEYGSAVGADAVWSSDGYSIAQNNAVYLLNPDGAVVDLVGFGEANAYEGASAQNPDATNGLARMSKTDTDNNRVDFALALASPRSAKLGTGFVAPERMSAAVSPEPLRSDAPTPAAVSSVHPTPTPLPTSPQTVAPVPTPELTPTATPVPTPSAMPVAYPVIVQVQFGIEGNANADFIRLQNQSSAPLDLTDYKLVKKTVSSGAEYSLKSWRNDPQTISAGAYFSWVNSGYADKIAELEAQGDAVFATSATITQTNGVALKYQDAVVASLQW